MSSPTFRPIPVQSTADHNDLTGLQGGTADQYYHVTAAQSAGVVVGPASATDNAIARYDATTGKLIQDSLATVSDTGTINVPSGQTYQIGGQALYPNGIISPVIYNRYTGQPSTLTLSSDIEMRFFKDDFSVDSLAQYTQTGTVAIASGAATIETTEKIIKALQAGDTTGKWDTVCKFTTTYSVDQSCKLYFGATSYIDIQRKTGNAIYLQLTVNGSSLIASTDTTATLADDTYGRASVTYDGTNYQMIWNGVAVGSATAGTVPTTPSIGVLATASTVVLDELSYIPSVAYTDPCSADLTARLATVTGTDAAFDTDKYNLVANTDSKYRLKSYQFGSGSRIFKFTLPASCNDGDYVNMRFCSIGDLSLGYGVGVIRVSGAWNAYTVKDVTGTTGGVITDLADGNTVYIEVERSSEHGVYWYYIYETTKPTSPTGKIFDASYSYGYSGIVCHSASGSKTFVLNSIEVRSHSLIGETNVPATETNFYFKDDFEVDSVGRFVTTGAWAVGSGILSCSSAGNCTFPFKTTIGTHTFIPTIADGTHYYYFGGYRLRFVASGGNSCVITLQTTAGVAVGSGSLTVTTTSGAFSNPVVITEASTSISVTVTGASGTITPGTTTSTNAYPKFTIGAATSSIDNYIFTGTRYYNKPMLRGCQIGEYYDGLTSTPCTRFTDDFNWDTMAEWTDVRGLGSVTIDPTNAIVYMHASGGGGQALLLKSFTCSGGGYFRVYVGGSSGRGGLLINSDGTLNSSNFYHPTNGVLICTTGPGIFVGGTKVVAFISLTQNAWANVLYLPNVPVLYYWNDNETIYTVTDSRIITGYDKFLLWGYTHSDPYYAKFSNLSINAIESQLNTGVSLTLGGVPHGARYNTQEYAVKSFVNAARYGEYKAITAAKTTDYGHEDIEVYLKNSTDSSNITNDASETVAIALTDNAYTNVTKDVTLNADDQSDTITMQVRRKTAATDNTPACFVDFLALIPTVEV